MHSKITKPTAHLRFTCAVILLLGGLLSAPVTAVAATLLDDGTEWPNARPVTFDGGAEGLYFPGTSHIALLMTHRTQDLRVLGAPLALEPVRRGFHVLILNSRFDDEASVDWEWIAHDVRAGVRFLRDQPTITSVALLGWSGGAPTVSYYQAVAENGASFCQMPNKLTKCTDEQMSGWRYSDEVDALVFFEAHNGATNSLFKLNGAVTDEDNPDDLDPKLNPFSEANGYNPEGDSNYSEEFVDAYSKAQSRRMNGLIEKALKMRKDIEQGKRDPDDNDFVYHRASARLQEISTGVLGSTSQPRRLLRDDGTISDPHIIPTVRTPDPGQKEEDEESTVALTLTSFLSSAAIKSSHAQDRIDWCSTNYSTICAVQHISIPTLVMPGQAHYFMWDGEQIYEKSASTDKTFMMVEGMAHSMFGCLDCEGAPYLNATRNLWDFIEDWLNIRI